METKKNYDLFLWKLLNVIYPISFIYSMYETTNALEENLASLVIGVSVTPIVAFLIVKIFAAIAKGKSIAPRWIDLLTVYVIGLGFSLPAFAFSLNIYLMAIPILTIFAIFYVLTKAEKRYFQLK